MPTTYSWRTIDFRPAAVPGWRVFQIHADASTGVVPVAGWLIRDEVETDSLTREETLTNFREPVPVFMDGEGELNPVQELTNFWYVAGPGEPDPTPEDTQQECARRHQAAAELTRREAAS